MKFVKLDPRAIMPSRATHSSNGYDLCALDCARIPAGEWKLIPTGIGWTDIPANVCGLIWPKSKPSYKQGTDILAGDIDADYDQKDIGVILLNNMNEDLIIEAGQSIGQLVIQNYLTMPGEVTPREARVGGFGSTNK